MKKCIEFHLQQYEIPKLSSRYSTHIHKAGKGSIYFYRKIQILGAKSLKFLFLKKVLLKHIFSLAYLKELSSISCSFEGGNGDFPPCKV